jgi:DNA mismatch repair protein MutL
LSIRVLPEDVAAKIAAGEVVERPASVVKELIENALDAGGRSIQIEVRQGGRRLVRVADDGCGIPAAEVELAFARHATSKLATIDDLERIHTLGFRGEALTSIAAVSRVTLLTRTAGEQAGTFLRLDGGAIAERSSRGSPAGTIVTVENLFYNVPARLKFLRQDSTEAGQIYRVVTRYALAFPGCRFHLLSDGRSVFRSTGSGDAYDVLIAVYGLEVARQMMLVEAADARADPATGEVLPGVAVSGYIGVPSLHRANRSYITLFVNRRWVQDSSLAYAVSEAYHTMLPTGRHPLAVLEITLDPARVDVNVHPAKTEVKFRDQDAVFSAVQRAVRATLTDQAPIPHASMGAGAQDMWRGRERFVSAGQGAAASQFALEVQRPAPEADADRQRELLWGEEAHLPVLRVLGQVAQTYIVAEGPEGMYLIDQHAAHERVLYEQFMKKREQAEALAQTLLEPVAVELAPPQLATLEECQDALLSLGFVLEPFGGSTVIVRAVPAAIESTNPAAVLLGILDDVAAGGRPLAKEGESSLIASVCKQAAVKAGQTLSQQEMGELVRQLENTSMPRTCPHGRPTMIQLSTQQLAREFARQ